MTDFLGRLQGALRRVLPDDVALVVDAPPEPVTARADVAGLERAVYNLVLNARDAMPAAGGTSQERAWRHRPGPRHRPRLWQGRRRPRRGGVGRGPRYDLHAVASGTGRHRAAPGAGGGSRHSRTGTRGSPCTRARRRGPHGRSHEQRAHADDQRRRRRSSRRWLPSSPNRSHPSNCWRAWVACCGLPLRHERPANQSAPGESPAAKWRAVA
jgi:hypothetical protein